MNKHLCFGRRLMAIMLIICFASTLIPAGVSAESDGKPTNLIPLYVDDFSDGILAPNIAGARNNPDDPADTITEADGKLTFERKKWIWYTDKNYGEPAVEFYAKEDHTPVDGKIFIEFNLAKTREVVRLRFCDDKGNYITQLVWENDAFRFSWRDSAMTTKSKELKIPSKDTVKISLYSDVNSSRPRFYLWINDELQVNGGFSQTDLASANFVKFYVYTLVYASYGRAGTFTVSDLGIYSLGGDEGLLPEVNFEHEQIVDSDITWLTSDKLLTTDLVNGYLIDSLSLDALTEGANGSSVSWASSDESIISPDGTLTRPDSDTEVTLTAKIEYGTVWKEKTFKFKVPGKTNNINGLPGDITSIYYDNFADGEISDSIVAENLCTSKPADTLVEENSKLTFTRRQDISKDDEFGMPTISFVPSLDTESLSGKLLTEFIVSKTCDIVGINMGDEDGNCLADINWTGNSFNVSYRDANLASKTKTLYVDSESSAKVSIYTDLSGENPLYSLWINNEKKLDNVVSVSSFDTAELSSLKLSTYVKPGYSGTGSYTVDNVAIYRVGDDFEDIKDENFSDDGTPNEQRVDGDLAAISEDMLLSVPKTKDGYVVDPLELDCFITGENGSDISWKSSHEDIISSTGALTRPADDTEVTVTAVATFGDISKEKSFTYMVAGINTDIDGMRADRYPMYYDDFSDSSIAENIAVRNIKNTDDYFEKNSKFVLRTTSWASHEPGVMFYKDLNHNTLTGEFIMEYTVSKTCDIVRMRTNNAQWNYLNQIYWNADDFNIYYRDADKVTQTLKLNVPADSSAKVTILTKVGDTIPKFTMWVNNEMVLEDVYSCTNMSPSNVQWLQLYTLNTGNYGKVGDVIIDNVGFYKLLPEMSDAERVAADAKLITDESLIKTTTPLVGYAFEDLNLPAYGENGSRIEWTSSDESTVALNGKVMRDDEENVPVTLTAVIRSGDEQITKTFEVIILGNHVETSDVPNVVEMITENDFESSDTPNLITTNLTGGGTVNIEDGVVKLIKTGDGYAQVGVQIYTGEDEGSVASGLLGIEFDLERANSNALQIRSMDANGNLYYSMAWGSSGISAYYSNEPTTAGSSRSVWLGSTDKIHVNMMFDCENSSYWLWVNGKPAVVEKYSRSVGTSAICNTMFYLESKNEISIDNYQIYHAMPPKALRLKFDNAKFSDDNILNETPQAGNVIQKTVNLPHELPYGTTIEWESSHPDIIDPMTGEVTRPVGGSENPLVTLTANMENSGIAATRQFRYRVLRDYNNADDLQRAEAEDIIHSYLTDQAPNEIRTSLNLMDKGLYGSDIRWSSSDTSVITESGRVIRPRFDEPDKTVTLTASIGNYKKELEFTVLADEPPKDPMHTSDEDFFGVWNGSGFIKTPQLDYTNPELSAVKNCAKAGDYEGAKQALYEYFKTRNVPSPIALGARHSGWVDARADGMYELGEESAYWKGILTVTSDDYEQVTAAIYKPSALQKIECKTIELIARYNEATSAFILGTDADNPNMVPKLEVTVNGAVRTYKATGSATIRAGKYSRTHIDNNKELQAKMFGDFLGDETYRILLSFDLSDIEADDTISSAQLVVYAKKSSKSADSKHLWIIDNRNKPWNEKTIYWDGLNFTVHNYNGLVGGSDWMGARSSDVEFAYQMPRFGHARNTMTEYKYTGNEKYAYSLLGQVMDIIVDHGDQTPFPRSLDAGLRMHQWVPLINTYKDSPYFTVEFATAFMKYMYQQFEYFPSRGNATGNWREYEQLAVLYATSAYPELSNSASTKEACIESWNNAFKLSFMSDGSYIEDTLAYSASSFAMYRDFKKACVDSGTELPKEFDETLLKAAYYMVVAYGSSGYALQYGDAGGGKKTGPAYNEISDWYNDYELRFVDSLGKQGTEPSWTSYQFPEGRYTMMRSDWKSNAIYLHTSVRGGGGHGHADDNSIILIGNGKRLLVDAGKMTYNSYDASRLYGQSTQGHNTVVINDTSQRSGWGDEYSDRGHYNNWTTNSAFDFLSQTTISYAEHEHTRDILFIKDGLFVVSDLMKPDNKTKENNYKQYWHMAPEAAITGDDEINVLSSSYSDGKNLILASADDVDVVFEDGYYDTSDGTPTVNKAGIFEKSQVGDAVLDTVMYVANYKDAKVTAERVDTGRNPDEVTAIKINVFENGKSETYYYINNHTSNIGGEEITFGDYTTDAKVALVEEDKSGNIVSIVMSEGSMIEKDGDEIISVDNGTSDISAEFTSNKLTLISSDNSLEAEDIDVVLAKNVKTVSYNGESKAFTVSGDMISVDNDKADEIKPEDNNKHDGIMEKPAAGGGSGGGGGSSGSTVTPVPPTPEIVLPFNDIASHWAKDYITDLHSKAVVNGNPDGTYKPDNAITRCEFIAIAVRALGVSKAEYAGSFDDITSADWFASDVQTALNLGIISKDAKFRPADNITREEMAKIISGCAKQLGIAETETAPLTFDDTSSVSGWAVEFVEYVAANGLMNGKDGNVFDAKGNATRAETATVYSRLLAKSKF